MVVPASQNRDADVALARRCVEGDREAQRALFHAQKDRVHLVLYRILGSNREIEDVVQEAFLALYRSLRVYRGEASLATWTDRIATRAAFRHLSRRRERRAPLEAVPDLPAGGADPERWAHLREVARRLYAVLDELPPQYRVAYALHAIDGRSIEEVARLTDSTTIAAKNRVWRARRRVEARAAEDPLLADFVASSRGAAHAQNA